jgi:dihydroorotase
LNGAARLKLRGGRVIDPIAGFDGVAYLIIQDGLVVGYAQETGSADGEQSVDLAGLVVAPGFVDLHTHLREPGGEDRETISAGTRAAAAGGFTTVCAMPNTDPTIDTASDVAAILESAARTAVVRVLPIGTVTKRQAGQELSELAALAQAGAVAFSDDGFPVRSSRLMRHALEYSLIVDRPIVDHPEDVDLASGGVMHEGRVSALLGLPGKPSAAEDVVVARDIELARLTGGRLHLAHLSTAGAVEMVRRAKEEGVQVTAEATPHHLTLTEDLIAGQGGGQPYNTWAKVNPPLRSAVDVETLVRALVDGTIDAVATDHAPQTLVDKQREFELAANGISGLETALGLCLKLVHEGHISLLKLIDRMTCGPSSVFRLSHGSLRPGTPADLVIFDPDESWTVDPAKFYSKGRNTPLDGWRLRGRVRATLAQGQLVHGALS